MKLQFSKMHSLGNDFVVIDGRKTVLKNIPRLAKNLCDRRFGIGADQMLLLCNSRKADGKMRIWNADGSEVEMCGNGIRCLGKFIWDKKTRGREPEAVSKKPASVTGTLSIETLAGIKHLWKTGNLFRVDMGEPVFHAERIPVKIRQESGVRGLRSGHVIDYPLRVKDKTFRITCVSMGNPHAVIVVHDVRSVDLERYGPLIENHPYFPNRTNVEFIQILNRKSFKMRVWERGAGETMACGTGASASGVVSSLLGLTGREVTVRLPGGKLHINWSGQDNHVYMTGDAVTVFEGVMEI